VSPEVFQAHAGAMLRYFQMLLAARRREPTDDLLSALVAAREAEIAFRGLLERFGSMSLAVSPDALRWRPSTLIHGLESLPVRLRM
jgi:cytochrome P450